MNIEVVMEHAKQLVENLTGTEITSMKYKVKYNPENIDRLKSAICKAYKIPVDELMRKGRYQEIVRPRQMFYYFSSIRYGMRLIDAAGVFGHDHTTAIHSRDKVKSLISIKDQETLEKIRLISEYLK